LIDDGDGIFVNLEKDAVLLADGLVSVGGVPFELIEILD
jgi:hypothetical protein